MMKQNHVDGPALLLVLLHEYSSSQQPQYFFPNLQGRPTPCNVYLPLISKSIVQSSTRETRSVNRLSPEDI